MVDWNDIANRLGDGARNAGEAATSTPTRRGVLAGIASLGTLGAAERLTGGEVSETAGDAVEEVLESPMGVDVKDVNDFNEKSNDYLENANRRYAKKLQTDTFGGLPSDLEPDTTFDDGQYLTVGFDSEDFSETNGDALVNLTFDDESYTIVTNKATEMDGFDSDYGALAIRDGTKFDTSEIKELRNAYRRAENEAKSRMKDTNELITAGSSLERVSKDYEDEEEVPAVQAARENIDQLEEEKNAYDQDKQKFETYKDLFNRVLDKSPYEDGDQVGPEHEGRCTWQDLSDGNRSALQEAGYNQSNVDDIVDHDGGYVEVILDDGEEMAFETSC